MDVRVMKQALTILVAEDVNATPDGGARASTRMLKRVYRGLRRTKTTVLSDGVIARRDGLAGTGPFRAARGEAPGLRERRRDA